MFGAFRNDPFFAGDIPNINSMFMDPFGMHARHRNMHNAIANNAHMSAHQQQHQQRHNQQQQQQQLMMRNDDPFQMMMMSNPFQMMQSMMGNMNSMFGNMDQHQMMSNNDPNAHVYTSSTVMSYSNTGNGAPKIYQASTQTKQLPGGIKETRRAVKDSERGIEKVAVGHHIGEKAHVVERNRQRDGQMEELVNLENLDENEIEDFNREFEQKIQHGTHNPFSIDNRQHRSHHNQRSNQPLAIDDGRKRDKKKSKSTSSKKQ